MNWKAVSIGAALQIGLSVPVVAGPVNVPNDFTAGTTASAAQVNANFAAIETAVNDNDARITANESDITSNAAAIANNSAAITSLAAAMQSQRGPRVVDGNGNDLGTLLDFSIDGVQFLTDQNYVTSVLPTNGQTGGYTGGLSFSGANCTGTAYSPDPAGSVFRAFDAAGSALYYVDRNSLPITNASINSSINYAGACASGSGTLTFIVWPALPNDPNVTGVSNPPVPLPIKLQ